MEEVIWKEKGEDDATNKMEFPALESMTLFDLPELIDFCSGTGEIEFPQLKKLSLGHLPRLIGFCSGTGEIKFPQLKELSLTYLPNLIGFCSGIDEIEFPQLKELRLQKLPQLKWLFLNSSNPFSESMENHNATFLSLFPHKVALPSLEELELKDLDNLEGLEHIPISVAFPSLEELELHGFQNMNEIWCNQLQTGSFNKLFSLDVSDCGSLRNMFSPFMARHLVHLKRLVIIRCSMMEEVVAKEEEEGGRTNRTPLPKLEYLELKDLPELKSFCHIAHDWELPLVEHITILKCPKLKTFSPGVICTPKLQRVFVKDRKYGRFIGVKGEDWLWISDLNQTTLHLIEKQQEEKLQKQQHEGENEETCKISEDNDGDEETCETSNDSDGDEETGKGKASKKAKPEPSKEEMHAVVVNILKEVDFNNATLSDILRQLGTHFGVDLMHRKAEVKAVIMDVINSMSDEEDEEEEADSGDDAEKDEDSDNDA